MKLLPISKSRWQPTRRHGVSWSPVLFLLAFLAILGVVAYFLMEPLLRMIGESSTPEQRRKLSAYALLFVCILLAMLLTGLVISLRIGWSMRIRESEPRRKSTPINPDPWSEAGRRAATPSPEELENPDTPPTPPKET